MIPNGPFCNLQLTGNFRHWNELVKQVLSLVHALLIKLIASPTFFFPVEQPIRAFFTICPGVTLNRTHSNTQCLGSLPPTAPVHLYHVHHSVAAIVLIRLVMTT